MAYQGSGDSLSLPFDAAIAANTIVMASTVNAGNAKASTAKAQGFLGVTGEPTDANLYARVITRGVVQIIAGGNITAGNYIASDANGNAVVNTPVFTGGASVAQIAGVALNTVASGSLVDVLLMPQLALN